MKRLAVLLAALVACGLGATARNVTVNSPACVWRCQEPIYPVRGCCNVDNGSCCEVP